MGGEQRPARIQFDGPETVELDQHLAGIVQRRPDDLFGHVEADG
jgi:hypothetical protein